MEAYTRVEGETTHKGWKGNTYQSHSSIDCNFMSYFKIPISLCKELEMMMARFWWGDQTDAKKIHWVSWAKMRWPRELGGMRFKDLHNFNLAMLAKEVWRIMYNEDSLVARILKARYSPTTNILNAHRGPNPSYTWRSLMEGRKALEKGALWRVGTSFDFNIWSDPWLPSGPNHKDRTAEDESYGINRVSQLILSQPRRWDSDLVNAIFHPEDPQEILEIPLSQGSLHDSLLEL